MSLLQTSTKQSLSAGIPRSLIYESTLPRGFASSFKRWEINPQTTYQIYNPTDTIRFILETQDFIDPYNSYLELEIEFDPLDYVVTQTIQGTAGSYTKGCPIFMLDGPATSLVSQMILYSNAREIERVQEYDQVGMLIQDLYNDHNKRWFYPGEGQNMYRSFNHDNGAYQQIKQSSQTSFESNGHTADKSIANSGTMGVASFTTQGVNGVNVSVPLGINTRYYLPGDRLIKTAGVFYQTGTGLFNGQHKYSVAGGAAIGFLDRLTPALQQTFVKQATTNNQYFQVTNNQGSYTLEFIAFDGSNGVQGTQTAISGMEQCATLTDTPYIDYSANHNIQCYLDTGSNAIGLTAYSDNNWSTFNSTTDQFIQTTPGFIRPYSAGSALNIGVYFAPTVLKHTIFNGCFLNYWSLHSNAATNLGRQPTFYPSSTAQQRYYETRRTFLVPILSGVLGTLIPESQWKLIPGTGCGQLLFEFRFNPYAFFASGPNFDSLEYFNNFALRGGYQASRDQWTIKYRFTKVSMKFDLWNFGETVQQQIQSQLSNGIYMTSRMFTQGPTYKVPNSSSATNSWQINNGIQSLRTIFFYFLSDEYQTYNYCRKNYRLSRNLTQMQLKIGQNYIPQNGPIIGHSGMLHKNSQVQQNYYPFYQELLRTTTSQFQTALVPGNYAYECLSITPEQFILDQRPYNPNNINEVAYNHALFHETRCRGQAIYAFDLLSDPFDSTYMTGIDTTKYRPIELQLRSSPDVILTPTNSTISIQCKWNIHCGVRMNFNQNPEYVLHLDLHLKQ